MRAYRARCGQRHPARRRSRALADPAAAPDSAGACAAAALSRLAESLVDDPPAAARLRIGGGAW